MSNRSIIHTDNAPAAVGTYSQAVKVGKRSTYRVRSLLIPETMELVEDFGQVHHWYSKTSLKIGCGRLVFRLMTSPS